MQQQPYTPPPAPMTPPPVPTCLRRESPIIQHAWRAWYANRLAKNDRLSRDGRRAWYAHKANALRAVLDAAPDPALVAYGTGQDPNGTPLLYLDLRGIGQCSFHVLLDQSDALRTIWRRIPAYPFRWIGQGMLTWPRLNTLDPSRLVGLPAQYQAGLLDYASAHQLLVRAGLSPALLQAPAVAHG